MNNVVGYFHFCKAKSIILFKPFYSFAFISLINSLNATPLGAPEEGLIRPAADQSVKADYAVKFLPPSLHNALTAFVSPPVAPTPQQLEEIANGDALPDDFMNISNPGMTLA